MNTEDKDNEQQDRIWLADRAGRLSGLPRYQDADPDSK